jgi:ADP-ribosylglycohydrolase
MLGAVLGDIIGSRFEFNDELKKQKTEKFQLFTKDCYFTDDTVMTIATADALLHGKDLVNTYQAWGRKYPDAGYGGMFEAWLKEDNPKPYDSWGNGSAMRVSPVGWLYDNFYAVERVAEETAMVSHNHPEGIKGALAVADCIFLARTGESKAFIKKQIEERFDYDLSRTIAEIRPDYKFYVSCMQSVPESIICFLESKNYQDAVCKAVSLGGDTDTMACITGGIAEAFYGFNWKMRIEIYRYLRRYIPYDMQIVLGMFENRIAGKR